MDCKTILLQRPDHPKWSTEVIQALSKFQGHFLQKETKWWFERRNSGCRVYDDLSLERWQKCAGFRALPINTALSCSPDLLDRTLHNFPVWQESTYIKQRQSEETPVMNIKGGRGGSRMTSLPGAGSCELGAGKRNLSTSPVAVWHARVLRGSGALQPPRHPVIAETPTPTRPAAPNPETPSIQMGILAGILMAL